MSKSSSLKVWELQSQIESEQRDQEMGVSIVSSFRKHYVIRYLTGLQVEKERRNVMR